MSQKSAAAYVFQQQLPPQAPARFQRHPPFKANPLLAHAHALLQAPFTITKTGPSSVKVGEAFDYNLVVTFLGSATGVVVSDELPAQLTATSSPGTWKAITVNGANPSGGKCVQLAVRGCTACQTQVWLHSCAAVWSA